MKKLSNLMGLLGLILTVSCTSKTPNNEGGQVSPEAPVAHTQPTGDPQASNPNQPSDQNSNDNDDIVTDDSIFDGTTEDPADVVNSGGNPSQGDPIRVGPDRPSVPPGTPVTVDNSDLLLPKDAFEFKLFQELNRARTNPLEYATELEAYRSPEAPLELEEAITFLRKQKPLPPLRPSYGLSLSAHDLVIERGRTGQIRSTYGAEPFPFARMSRYGTWSIVAGEIAYYGNISPEDMVISWIVDQGILGRTHRTNIYEKEYHFAGLSCGGHKVRGKVCVVDFAAVYTRK